MRSCLRLLCVGQLLLSAAGAHPRSKSPLPDWCTTPAAVQLASQTDGYHIHGGDPRFGHAVMATVARKLADARCPATVSLGIPATLHANRAATPLRRYVATAHLNHHLGPRQPPTRHSAPNANEGER